MGGWFGRIGYDRTYVWYYFELELFGKGEKTHEEHCVELKMGLAQLVEFRKKRRRVRERAVDGGGGCFVRKRPRGLERFVVERASFWIDRLAGSGSRKE